MYTKNIFQNTCGSVFSALQLLLEQILRPLECICSVWFAKSNSKKNYFYTFLTFYEINRFQELKLEITLKKVLSAQSSAWR